LFWYFFSSISISEFKLKSDFYGRMAGSAGKIPVLGHGSKFCNEKLYTYV
jgi:hypothetical protein